ncbi:hypothetical protein [Sphingomonas sp.]|uniref:hypothetical protein n=1 Tax=Sphingomonas sp. TaxID=28214 RepID=UPI003B3B0121
MTPLLMLAAMLLAAPQDDAADAQPPQDELIHSDLPLWAGDADTMWPRSFQDDASFGCVTKIAYGDWRFDSSDPEEDPTWYRWTNYGVVHCIMMSRDAERRSMLRAAPSRAAYLIELGTAVGRQGPVALWALQQGAMPGSDYILLSSAPQSGVVTAFDVLPRECPAEYWRQGPQLSILKTSYCAITSRDALIAMARRMVLRPPLGRLVLQSK